MGHKEININDEAQTYYYENIDNYVEPSEAFTDGANYVLNHLHTEIDRLKGLIEEAVIDAYDAGLQDYLQGNHNTTAYLKQFKQKNGL